jgi:hypothetical protein
MSLSPSQEVALARLLAAQRRFIAADSLGVHVVQYFATAYCAASVMCPPNRDVTVSAIYKCHSSVVGVGRRAGVKPQRSAAPERRPIERSSQPHPLFYRASAARSARRATQPTLNRRASR